MAANQPNRDFACEIKVLKTEHAVQMPTAGDMVLPSVSGARLWLG